MSATTLHTQTRTNLIPELRFQDFKDEWLVITIQQLIEQEYLAGHLDGNHGELYPKAEEFTESGIPYVSANDFIDGKVTFERCKFLTKERAETFKKGIAKNGDVLFAHNATVGPTAVLETSYPYVVLSTTATYYRCNPERLVNYFLKNFFQTDFFIKQYSRVKSQSTRDQVPITQQRKFNSYLPSFTEQQKIASFLSAVDDKIQQLKKKKDLLEQYKKGVMQKLFSQEIRFKDEDGEEYPEWKEKQLGNYLELYTEKVPATTQFPVLTSSRTGLKIQREYFDNRKISNEGEYGVVPRDYFVYRHMSDDSTFKFNINTICTKGAVSKEYPVFTAVGMSNKYLNYVLNEGNEIKRFAVVQKKGGTRVRLYFKTLCTLKLKIPSILEQQIIARFLSEIDLKMETLSNELTQMQTFKKGLLQQMFV